MPRDIFSQPPYLRSARVASNNGITPSFWMISGPGAFMGATYFTDMAVAKGYVKGDGNLARCMAKRHQYSRKPRMFLRLLVLLSLAISKIDHYFPVPFLQHVEFRIKVQTCKISPNLGSSRPDLNISHEGKRKGILNHFLMPTRDDQVQKARGTEEGERE